MNEIGVHTQKNSFIPNLNSQVVEGMAKKKLAFTSRGRAKMTFTK